MDTLRKRCGEHLSALAVLCPDIPEAALVRSQDPTEQNLYLPSSFSKPLRQEYGLAVLARKEGELRIGNAHDHLAALKDALGLQTMLIQAKQAHVRGNDARTRAETTVKRAGEVIKRHKEGYKRNWTLMGKLNVDLVGDDSPAKGLKELKDDDVRSLRKFIRSDTHPGDSGELPWIWRTVGTVLPQGAKMTDVKQAVRDWEQEGKLTGPVGRFFSFPNANFPISFTLNLGTCPFCSRPMVGGTSPPIRRAQKNCCNL